MSNKIMLGNFTGLGEAYALSRPDYSPKILDVAAGLFGKRSDQLDVVDIGAGTGIWTRMIARYGVRSLRAIEPNQDMRANATDDDSLISWSNGTAEVTGLPDSNVDWVTMASSFHWANFDIALKEFHRILKPEGYFTALWNPRLIENNPLLQDIEEYLKKLKPDMKRVSSGNSEFTSKLTDKLEESSYFKDVVYVDARHTIEMSPERYLKVWRSVNDIRVQLGEQLFNDFLTYVEKKIHEVNLINSTYLTRAWFAKVKNK
jgi:ubiquinone/menaquinone biosynthesis C-methylase UbiE